MNQGQRKRMYQLLSLLGWSNRKEFFVLIYTGQRTESTKEMSVAEAQRLVDMLTGQEKELLKPMRGKIIHLLCLMGYVKANAAADYVRINAFVENIGTNNPRKKKLYGLWKSELVEVLNQVELMYKKQVEAANKK